jgi:hypothetical protein
MTIQYNPTHPTSKEPTKTTTSQTCAEITTETYIKTGTSTTPHYTTTDNNKTDFVRS